VYTETAESKSSSMKRERQIKRWTKAKKEALITGKRQQQQTVSFKLTRNSLLT